MPVILHLGHRCILLKYVLKVALQMASQLLYKLVRVHSLQLLNAYSFLFLQEALNKVLAIIRDEKRPVRFGTYNANEASFFTVPIAVR